MKNTSLSALVVVGAAGLVGWIAWTVSGDEATEATPEVVAPVVTAAPNVMQLTPHERRLKGRLEAAKRELARYKKQGEILPKGAIKVPDVDGSPLYVHPELIEGTGRHGEPLYAMVKYKRRAALPLREMRQVPKKAQPKVAHKTRKQLREEKQAYRKAQRAGEVPANDVDPNKILDELGLSSDG